MKANKWTLGMAAAAVVCAMSWLSAGAAEDGNLLKNAGFEEKENPILHWRNDPSGPLAVTVARAEREEDVTAGKTDVHSGQQAIRLTDKTDKGMGLFYSLSKVEVKEGEQFEMGAWVKGPGKAALGCYEYGDGKFIQTVLPTATTLKESWQEMKWSYTVPAGVKSVLMVLSLPEEEGQPPVSVVIDDAYCRKVTK